MIIDGLLAVIVFVAPSLLVVLGMLRRYNYKSTEFPDPIELEARRLAEQEMDEFCASFEVALGIRQLPQPVLLVKDARIRASFSAPAHCMGCGEKFDFDEIGDHFHQYNSYGDLVYCSSAS